MTQPDFSVTPTADPVQIADFSLHVEPFRFSMDGDEYSCYAILPIPAIQDLAHATANGGIDPNDVDGSVKTLTMLMETVMEPESAARFNARLTGRDRPLDLRRQVLPVLYWILEKHGLRPTQPSSDSLSGSSSETGGTTSTAGASSSGSIPPS